MSDTDDRIERSFHPDGSPAEEIHFRGTVKHGPWRTWHPNGQLAIERFLEMGELNGTARHWSPDGRLRSESTFANGRSTLLRVYSERGRIIFDSVKTRRDQIRKFATRAGKAKPLASPRNPSPDDELIAQLLASPTAEALLWLRGASERTLGEFDSALSIELVTTLHDLGAANVLVAEIDRSQGPETSNILILPLPADPAARARIFAFVNAYSKDQGFDAERDRGQPHLFLKLC